MLKREPAASAPQSATIQLRRFPKTSASASIVKATALECATNHTSPYIEHHHKSVPTKKNATRISRVFDGTSRRLATCHAAPTAIPPRTDASNVSFVCFPKKNAAGIRKSA